MLIHANWMIKCLTKTLNKKAHLSWSHTLFIEWKGLSNITVLRISLWQISGSHLHIEICLIYEGYFSFAFATTGKGIQSSNSLISFEYKSKNLFSWNQVTVDTRRFSSMFLCPSIHGKVINNKMLVKYLLLKFNFISVKKII